MGKRIYATLFGTILQCAIHLSGLDNGASNRLVIHCTPQSALLVSLILRSDYLYPSIFLSVILFLGLPIMMSLLSFISMR